MIDINDQNQVLNISKELYGYSLKYYDYKTRWGRVRTEFNIILASKIKEIRSLKNNAGLEMAQLLLINICGKDVEKLYEEMIALEAKTKAFEKIINALETQISLIQSLIKNQIRNGVN